MRIIKERRKELANPELKFICRSCGCEFVENAPNCESITTTFIKVGEEASYKVKACYKTKCPCCGDDCYSSTQI